MYPKPRYCILSSSQIMRMSSLSILSLFLSFFILSLASAHQWDSLTGSRLGDANPAIVDLKKYLHHFGYLDSQHHTDSFDDELHVALRRYQQNFNLEVTGIIDPPTTRLLTTPRCGVPDVIPNVTSGGGKLHYSFFKGNPRWPTSRRQLSYAIVSGYRGIDSYTVSRIMASAFRRWEAVTDFRFNEINPYSKADITIGFYSGDHGDGFPFDGRLRILAHAFRPVNGRFHIDADEVWSTDISTATSPYAVDLESVSVHEIGHLLGLDHSTYRPAIMYPNFGPLTRKVDLWDDDVQGISVLYGYPPPIKEKLDVAY